eukprot:3568040-Pyramimonas_sp.AAC.2
MQGAGRLGYWPHDPECGPEFGSLLSARGRSAWTPASSGAGMVTPPRIARPTSTTCWCST